jgi:hypothetical protein
MPATSKAQFRFMEAIKHGGIKKKGLSPEKASEYVEGGKHAYDSLPAKASPAGKHFAKLRKCMGGKV